MYRKFTVRGTKIREKTQGQFLVKMNPKSISMLKRIQNGKRVFVSHEQDGHIYTVSAMLQADDSVDEEDIEVDQKIREALFVRKCEKVFLKPYENPKGPSVNNFFNKLFGIQTNIVCVKSANKNDMELPLCRISAHTMETIGVESGDTIIIESPTSSIRMKIFELTNDIIRQRIDSIPEEKKETLPWILMDFDARSHLGIKKNDPVIIYRDLNYLAGKKVHLLSEPLVLTIIGAILGFDLSTQLQIGILALGMFLVIIFNFIDLRK
ncbi:MAG: hypothetical protein JXJ04_10835 [Spirochaetales bacterium]|nr:hypothetical protein [Spirochaetales bacterium]